MSPVMPNDPARKKIIKQIIKSQEDDADGRDIPSAKIIVKGKAVVSPIYRFRLSDLHYNKTNGRIKAEVLALQAKLGRELDMEDEKDRNRVKDLLLKIRRDENDKIKEDLKNNGQLQPGVITCDGVIINGNRRRALLEELILDTHKDTYDCFDAHVLPSDITKREIWLIEAGIQLSAPQQLDYSPINHLLKLREGIDSGIEIADMEAAIYGVDATKLSRDLARLELINEYLESFLKKPGRYHLVDGLAEHFINLQNMLERVENPKGPGHRDWVPDENDLNELKLVAFFYIRARYQHLRIRNLKNLFWRSSSWEYLRQTLELPDKPQIDEPDLDDLKEELEENQEEPDFESEGDTVVITGAEVEADKRMEKAWLGEVGRDLKKHFQDAKEQEEIEKDREKPLALAQRALRNIRGIPEDCSELSDPELDSVLAQIIGEINNLRKHTKKERKAIVKARGKSRRSKKESGKSRRRKA